MEKTQTVQLKRKQMPYYHVILERILSDKNIPEANRAAIQNMMVFNQSRGSKPNTICKHLYCFERFLKALGDIDIPKTTKADMERAFAKIESQEIAAETKRQIRVVIKLYYKHAFGEDEFFPPTVRWLKTTNKPSDRLLPTDLINEQDILKMLDACKNKRDKAILSLLFERGLRASELLGIRKGDVNLTDNPPYVIVNLSKTMPRRIPITFSAGFIANYMMEEKITALNHDDCLWQPLTSAERQDKFDYDTLRTMMHTVADRAKIKKRIYLHLFRHSAASRIASEVPESVLREIMGWAKGSIMPSRYVHLSGRSVDRALLAMDGIEPEEKVSKLQVRVCGKCKFPNYIGSYHCARCNESLEVKNIEEIFKNKQLMRTIVAKAIADDKYFDEIIRGLKA